MPTSVEEVFDGLEERYIPGVVKNTQTFYFSLDDKQYTVTLEPQRCVVEKGKTVEKADAYLKTSGDLFLKVVNREYTPGMSDILTGRVKSNNPLALKVFMDAFRVD